MLRVPSPPLLLPESPLFVRDAGALDVAEEAAAVPCELRAGAVVGALAVVTWVTTTGLVAPGEADCVSTITVVPTSAVDGSCVDPTITEVTCDAPLGVTTTVVGAMGDEGATTTVLVPAAAVGDGADEGACDGVTITVDAGMEDAAREETALAVDGSAAVEATTVAVDTAAGVVKEKADDDTALGKDAAAGVRPAMAISVRKVKEDLGAVEERPFRRRVEVWAVWVEVAVVIEDDGDDEVESCEDGAIPERAKPGVVMLGRKQRLQDDDY